MEDPARWPDRRQEALWQISSSERGWRGFLALLVGVSGGTSEPTVIARHNVTMLVGSPLRTTATCDERAAARFQSPGDFDILPAGSSVSWIDEGNSTFLAVGVERELIEETAHEMGLAADRISIVPQFTCRDPRIEHLLWALKAELENKLPNGRLYADSLGVALAAQLVRRWTSYDVPDPSGGLPKRRLERVLAYIQERLSQDLTLAEIAATAGVSPSHFQFLFRRSVGVSPHRYVVARRVERAAELLVQTQLPISEVALLAGFANQSHMASSVRRSIGMTPKALRNCS